MTKNQYRHFLTLLNKFEITVRNHSQKEKYHYDRFTELDSKLNNSKNKLRNYIRYFNI